MKKILVQNLDGLLPIYVGSGHWARSRRRRGRRRACRALGAGARGWRADGRTGLAGAGRGRRRWGAQASGTAWARGARADAQAAGAQGRSERRRQRARQAWARGAQGVSVRSARRGRAGSAASVCLCAQAGRLGWSAGLVLVHSAPGSVLTQSLTGLTRYFS